jgi:ABC-2 type transport system ATP-binding protein
MTNDGIQARRLTKRYGSTLAVDDLSFDVLPGRVTGFLGPNGAGKSTTMRMIIDLDAPTSGSVMVGGRRYREHRRPLHDVGAVLETRAIHPGRSAYNHLRCLAESNGIRRQRVDEVLGLVGLGEVAARRARGFSLGMSQRLGLAAALLGVPPVIMCDEPVNGLDPERIHWIRTLLRRLAAEGRTVFVSSHLMSDMAATADHRIVVGHGRLLADASVEEVTAARGRPTTTVVSPDADRLAALIRAAGGEVTPVRSSALLVTGLSAVESAILPGSTGSHCTRRAARRADQLRVVHALPSVALGQGRGPITVRPGGAACRGRDGLVLRCHRGARLRGGSGDPAHGGPLSTFFAVLFAPSALVDLLPTSVRNDLINYMPANAGSQIFTANNSDRALGPWQGFGVFCLYAGVALMVGVVLVSAGDT